MACRARGLAIATAPSVIKLTRLNRKPVVINPDNVLWADATPDTTLCLTSGERILVRESLEEMVELVVSYQQAVRAKADFSARPTEESEV